MTEIEWREIEAPLVYSGTGAERQMIDTVKWDKTLDPTPMDACDRLVAQLGNDNWELVGVWGSISYRLRKSIRRSRGRWLYRRVTGSIQLDIRPNDPHQISVIGNDFAGLPQDLINYMRKTGWGFVGQQDSSLVFKATANS